MKNNVVSNDNDDTCYIQQNNEKNGSSPINQDQFDKLINLLQSSSSTSSNQFDTSLFTCPSRVNKKGNYRSFIYKFYTLDS